LFLGAVLSFAATAYTFTTIYDPAFLKGVGTFTALTLAAIKLKSHSIKNLDIVHSTEDEK